jgi:hypothetical protein
MANRANAPARRATPNAYGTNTPCTANTVLSAVVSGLPSGPASSTRTRPTCQIVRRLSLIVPGTSVSAVVEIEQSEPVSVAGSGVQGMSKLYWKGHRRPSPEPRSNSRRGPTRPLGTYFDEDPHRGVSCR